MALFRLNPLAPQEPALSIANTDDVLQLGDRLKGVRLIALHFPKFTDGRAYSQARLLRERLGYAGARQGAHAVQRGLPADRRRPRHGRPVTTRAAQQRRRLGRGR